MLIMSMVMSLFSYLMSMIKGLLIQDYVHCEKNEAKVQIQFAH